MALSPFIDTMIARVRRTSPSVDLFPAEVASGGLFGGASGVAFFLHDAARLRSPSLMGLAAQWADVAEAWSRTATPAQWSPTGAEVRWGLHHGLGGVAYVRLLVSSALDDRNGMTRGVEMLATACAEVVKQRARSTFLFEGAAGLLRATEQLRGRVSVDLAVDLTKLGESLWGYLADHLSKPLAQREGNRSLGMAHGIAGELWAAVERTGDAPLPQFLRDRLDELIDASQRDEELLLSPWGVGQEFGELAHGICNGMAGHAVLWSTVARRGEYSQIAALVARALDALGPAPDASLCCGLAGQAIAHARVDSFSRSALHRRRGLARLHRAATHSLGRLDADDALCLWNGALGVATVALLRLAGESHLPCFALPEPCRATVPVAESPAAPIRTSPSSRPARG